MFVFIEDKDTFDNFNNPLAIKIDFKQLLNSIKWPNIDKEKFFEIQQTLKCYTYKELLFGFFQCLEGNLVVFNISIIQLIEDCSRIDLRVEPLVLNIYEVSNRTTNSNITVLDLPRLNRLIKANFN